MPVSRELYYCYWVLSSAKDTVKEYEEEYHMLLEGVHTGKYEDKIFLAEMIPKFLLAFPHLESKALLAQLKLCSDADKSISHEAMKELPKFSTAEFMMWVRRFLTARLKSANASERDFLTGILGSVAKDKRSNSGTEPAPKRFKEDLALNDGPSTNVVPSTRYRVVHAESMNTPSAEKPCFSELGGAST